jgi:long-chain acyl-CoA synthetase
MNVADAFVSTAAARPTDIAVRSAGASWTYQEIERASAHVADLLRSRGITPGDRVGLMLPNVAEFPAVYFGILRTGAVVIPMNPLLKSREVAYYLEDSGAGLLFATGDAADQIREGTGADVVAVTSDWFTDTEGVETTGVVDRAPDDTAVLLYTSGTTGHPKGAELTHANLVRNADVMREDLITLTEEDVVFGGLPLFHAFGQTCTLNTSLGVGASLAVLPRFNPAQALEMIARDKITIFAGVPTMYIALLSVPDRERYDVSSLRVCVSGGAAMPVEIFRAFEEAFGCIVLEGYGLSETSPVASFNHPGRERKVGSIGTPIRGVEMRVVDDKGVEVPAGEVGEISIKGHNVMKGYWQRPDATAAVLQDGWFRTGDMGRIDPDGYFFIVGRKKELIIRGGYNVYPREIEEVMHEHPAVAEAAVIGVPHPALGEEVAAAVVLKPGETVTADELRSWVAERVAAYKYPRHVWLVDDLPKTSTGKVQKSMIVPPAGIGDR